MLEQVRWTIGDIYAAVWDWLSDHIAGIVALFCVAFIAFCLYMIFVGIDQRRAEDITLCQRAFEYTVEQCEFIVRNRVIPHR